MTAGGLLPFPPASLPSTTLPVTVVPAGTGWTRIHWPDDDPLWFGPEQGAPPLYRFDDPDGEFRVCYLGETPAASFAETFLRNTPVRLLAKGDLAARSIARVQVVVSVTLVALHGPNLARLGATATVTSGPYHLSRAWSRALWAHSSRPHGLLYHARHDHEVLCIALFGHAAAALAVVDTVPLTADARQLESLLARYGIGLTP